MNTSNTKFVILNLPISQAILLEAKHGVGKSSVVKQCAIEEGATLIDLRLSQCEVGDLKGLPILNTETRRTEFLKPYWWPRDNGRYYLFLDELNRATKDVLQAVFELCLDRRLDGEYLPENTRIIAAINPSDNYDVVELDPALFSRFFKIDFDPEIQEWIDWANASGVHPSIAEFILQNKEMLDPPMENMQSGEVYPSRRSWEQLSKSLVKLGMYNDVESSLFIQISKGWIGQIPAIQYHKFVKNEFSRIKAEDVLDNFSKVKKKLERSLNDIEIISAVANSLIQEIKLRGKATMTNQNIMNIRAFALILPFDVFSSFVLMMLNTAGMKEEIRSWSSKENHELCDKYHQVYKIGKYSEKE